MCSKALLKFEDWYFDYQVQECQNGEYFQTAFLLLFVSKQWEAQLMLLLKIFFLIFESVSFEGFYNHNITLLYVSIQIL